ncbi:MAG: hypothetical protein ACP5I4_16770 [Oceanipulchritudo sp.]
MKIRIPLSLTIIFAFTFNATAQVQILNTFDTFVEIWGDGQTKRDTEPVMAARNSYESSNVQVGFRELAGVPLTKFDVSSLTPADLVGKQVLFQIALAGFDIDPDSDGATVGVYNLPDDDIDNTAILFGPKVDFVDLTVALDWAGNDYLAGAPFPGVAISRDDISLIDTVELTRSFLDGGVVDDPDIIGSDVSADGVWNNYTNTLSFDVTSVVAGWVDGTIDNNGLAVWLDPLLPLNAPLEQINFTTFENTNATGAPGGSAPARLYIVDAPVAVPVPLISGSISGPDFVISVPSDSAYNYTLQVSGDLSAGSWSDVETQPGDGSVLTFSQLVPAAGDKDFYQVVVTPK